jgi:hypothetical protein
MQLNYRGKTSPSLGISTTKFPSSLYYESEWERRWISSMSYIRRFYGVII